MNNTIFEPAYNGLFILRELVQGKWHTTAAYKHKELRKLRVNGVLTREHLLECAGIFNNCPSCMFEKLTDAQIIDMLED